MQRNQAIEFKIVEKLDPREGWASSEFWQARWSTTHREILQLVALGYVEAALERGSKVGRFRCSDETEIVALPKIQTKPLQRGACFDASRFFRGRC
jgi:hypothetical protein